MRFVSQLAVAAGAGVLAMLSANASAAVVAFYPIDTASDFTSQDTEPTSSASEIGFGPGVGDGFVGGSGSRGNPPSSLVLGIPVTAGLGLNQLTSSSAEADGDYLSFTVTPGAGTPLTFTRIAFEAVRENEALASISGTPSNWYLRSSADDLAADLVTGTLRADWTDPNTGEPGNINGSQPWHWDAQAGDFVLANITEPVTFHLGFYGMAAQTHVFRVDNVALEATVVPEPASLGLLGVAALGLLARRRRTR